MRNYSIVWLDQQRRQDFDYIPASQWDQIRVENSYRIPKDAKMAGLQGMSKMTGIEYGTYISGVMWVLFWTWLIFRHYRE